MKDIALITIHGMGKVEHDYFSGLEDSLKNNLETTGQGFLFRIYNTRQYCKGHRTNYGTT